jgi:hypothetical protein
VFQVRPFASPMLPVVSASPVLRQHQLVEVRTGQGGAKVIAQGVVHSVSSDVRSTLPIASVRLQQLNTDRYVYVDFLATPVVRQDVNQPVYPQQGNQAIWLRPKGN